jgi:hypothetical protein
MPASTLGGCNDCAILDTLPIIFLHTKANKLTGFLLFIGMMTIEQSYFIPVAWVIACIALFAAIQEGHFIRSIIWKPTKSI